MTLQFSETLFQNNDLKELAILWILYILAEGWGGGQSLGDTLLKIFFNASRAPQNRPIYI